MGTNSKLHVEFKGIASGTGAGNKTANTYADTRLPEHVGGVPRARAAGKGKGLLVDYTGGTIGASFGSGTPSSRTQQFMGTDATRSFPGTNVASHWTGRATIDFWTGYQWTKRLVLLLEDRSVHEVSPAWSGARPGQLSFRRRAHVPQDNQGYLEGAVESGQVACDEILGDLKHA